MIKYGVHVSRMNVGRNVRSLSSGDELCCYTIICFYGKINVLIGGTPHKGRSYFSIESGENNNKNILLENLFFWKSLVVLSQIARFCSSTMILEVQPIKVCNVC